MCGIFGVLFHDGERVPEVARLQQSAASIHHRGPDSHGVHSAPGVGFAHARLSLLDLSTRSDQPMWDASGRYCVVYNGEIYNYQELRVELERDGVVFRTTSDTEVLLHGLIRWSAEEFLPRLEGMFAFAFWDERQRRLVLARDRFGIKPLSVYQDEQCLVFSSEVKAMKPWVNLRPDVNAMSAYLDGFGGSTRDGSFFEHVKILAPGMMMEVRPGHAPDSKSFFHVRDFWDPEARERFDRLRPTEAVDYVEQLLLKSVEKHLIADAPVGALCSGGIDSSLIMAMAARLHPNLAIFHADVKGPLSEYDAAQLLAKHLNLTLHVVEVADREFSQSIPSVIAHYEYPFSYHPSSVPFMHVAKLVREHGVKAVLSGEGSDETFLGYRSIAFEDVRRGYGRFVQRFRKVGQRIPGIRALLWPTEGTEESVDQRISTRFEKPMDLQRIRDHVRAISGDISPRELRTLEWLGYHLRTLLHRNDSLGMSASIEARFPFLDHELVHCAVNLPYRYKIRRALRSNDPLHPFLRDKWVVRAVADRYVPKALSRRPKRGFFIDAYRRMSVDPAFFDDSFVSDVFKLTDDERNYLIANAGPAIAVRLLQLEVWGRMFFRDESVDVLSDAVNAHVRVRPLSEVA